MSRADSEARSQAASADCEDPSFGTHAQREANITQRSGMNVRHPLCLDHGLSEAPETRERGTEFGHRPSVGRTNSASCRNYLRRCGVR